MKHQGEGLVVVVVVVVQVLQHGLLEEVALLEKNVWSIIYIRPMNIHVGRLSTQKTTGMIVLHEHAGRLGRTSAGSKFIDNVVLIYFLC